MATADTLWIELSPHFLQLFQEGFIFLRFTYCHPNAFVAMGLSAPETSNNAAIRHLQTIYFGTIEFKHSRSK